MADKKLMKKSFRAYVTLTITDGIPMVAFNNNGDVLTIETTQWSIDRVSERYGVQVTEVELPGRCEGGKGI